MSGKRLFQSVAEQIAELIDEGAFPPGTRLPGERELAERLGVSRVTIREAEIALQAVGRLEIKTGSGVYVSETQPASRVTLPKASAFEVTEARLLIESEAAALAAHNITEEAIARLEELIEQMGSPDNDTANEADEAFHLTIAEASNNAAMVHTIKSLWRMREEIPDVKATYEAVCVHDAETRTAEHRAVFEALRARDSAAARSAMRDHFHRLIAAMLDATEKMALEAVQQRALESRERFLASAKIG
ncbi:FadR/GntR family transcriptional regulator [Pelagerythrobacter aerophilus]|uniref:FadR family transcriptional regulator n=1 Tax=Pelagerythrobacter aerophilus TaxID=2306995 RepID=A0A418NIN2_9SPHN|nr:FadR/GntR family transcriptional regulator [Pelagerythrobacter aerophilus]RIV79197.1 FadR family transcriptional regulator [Pelagerythrobacter aerophilus]